MKKFNRPLVVMLSLIFAMAWVGPAFAMEHEKIDINTATAEQLATLDNIGDQKAAAIIEYREQNGPFEKIEDIINVSGIGEKTFEKNKDKITVSTPEKQE